MQGLSVYDKGIRYLSECLANYTGACAYLVIYAAAVVYLCVFGSRREKEIFIPCSVFLLVTVYNPAAPVLLNRFFDVNNEYYRFFWLAPVIILVPYLCARLIMTRTDMTQKIVAALLVAAVLACSGKYVYADGIKLATNIYKMPEELMEVSEMIHKDCEAEYPKAFLEYEYNMQMRQYDPKMMLTIDREDYLYAVMNPYTDKMLDDDEHPQYRLLASLIRLQPVEESRILDALELTKTEYVVLDKANPRVSFLLGAGLKKVGETAGHIVLRYELKERNDFELVDYTVVY